MFLDVEIIEGDLLQRFMMSEKELIKVSTKMKRSDRIVSVYKDKKENFKLFVCFFILAINEYFTTFIIILRL